jgi:hypothetical protein
LICKKSRTLELSTRKILFSLSADPDIEVGIVRVWGITYGSSPKVWDFLEDFASFGINGLHELVSLKEQLSIGVSGVLSDSFELLLDFVTDHGVMKL